MTFSPIFDDTEAKNIAKTYIYIYKVPLREVSVPKGVAQGHIIITTGRDGDCICLEYKKKCPEK